MYMGGRHKRMRTKKRKSESCIASVIYKIDSHITVTRDDGNLDAIMAEDFAPMESEDDEDGEEVISGNGLGDAIAKAWSLQAP